MRSLYLLAMFGVLVFGCNGGDDGDEGDEGMADTGEEGGSDPTDPSGPSSDPSSDPSGDPSSDPTTTPSGCDPAGCEDYCTWARCLFGDDIDGAKCMQACNTYCGDDFFEDSDAQLLECQASVTSDFNCADSQACCDNTLTNQICP